MTDIVLHDIEHTLLERIQRVAAAHSWTLQETLMRLLEHGLFTCEGELALRLSDRETTALAEAIAALETVPNDPGYALIGRAAEVPTAKHDPDQSIAPVFKLG